MQSELTIRFLGICLLASLAKAHMEMTDPSPFRSKNNPNANGDVDFDLVAPICGDSFPCNGYHSLLGSPAGAPVATWEAGSEQPITIAGGAPHEGGSCQVSLSLDGGESFTVIHSYVGECPETAPESTFSFRVPADTPSSDQAILSWSWLNRVGNREFYQNCAPITIRGGSSGGKEVPFEQRPDMFTANLGNGCETAASEDVMFPDPGPDVDVNNPGAAAPVGDCGSASPLPGAGGGDKTVVEEPGDESAVAAPQRCTCAGGESDENDDPLSMFTSDAESTDNEALTTYAVVFTALVLAVGMSLG